jgi:hypothetical protein
MTRSSGSRRGGSDATDGSNPTTIRKASTDDELGHQLLMNESSSSDEVEGANDGSEPSDGADTDDTNSRMNDESDNATPSLEYNYQYVPTPQSFSTEQLERIAVIEAAAANVHAVLVKYGNSSSLPPSLDPKDTITGKYKHGWEIDPNSPWADTPSAIDEIVSAGERLVRAWSRDDAENIDMTPKDDGASMKVSQKKQEWWESILSTDPTQNISNASSSESIRRNGDDAATNVQQPFTEEEQHQFHNVYMEFVTNAFEEELDALRKGQLEELTSARSKQMKSTKPSTTSSNSNSSGGAAMEQNESTLSMELDPTQYSFVVAGRANRDENRKGLDTEADVVAADVARMAAAQEIDIRVLSDMLYSGSTVLTISEKRMLLQARQRALLKETVMDVDTDASTGLTLHERRKREIGLC